MEWYALSYEETMVRYFSDIKLEYDAWGNLIKTTPTEDPARLAAEKACDKAWELNRG